MFVSGRTTSVTTVCVLENQMDACFTERLYEELRLYPYL